MIWLNQAHAKVLPGQLVWQMLRQANLSCFCAAVSFEDPLVNRTRPLSLLHSIIVRTKSNVFISVSRETKAAQALRDPRVRGGRPVDPVPSVRWDLKALQA